VSKKDAPGLGPSRPGGTPARETGEPRADLAKARERIAERARELDLIQALGRGSAEARTQDELFGAAIAVLQRSVEIDVAVVATGAGGRWQLDAHLSRPVEPDCLAELARRAGAVLGWPGEALPEPRCRETEAFDAGRGARRAFREEDLVALPILRGSEPAACLLLLPSRHVEEGGLRLFYSAGNQLSVHLDRILTAQEAEADRFRSILESMPQAVLLADADLRVAQANPAAQRLLRRIGLSGGAALEEVLERLGLAEAVEQVRGGGSPGAELEVSVDDRVLNATVSPLSARRPRSSGLVLVISDVTDRRRMQRRLAQSEKLSSLGQMISGVAHELNNPLASILGHAQLLGAKAGDEQLARRVEILQREALRCRKIVQNLLSFARRHEPERRPFSLNETVRSVLGLMGYQLRVNGIEVRTELSGELPPLTGDAHQVQQVLVNLLTNAQQAIRQAAERGIVELRTETAADGWVRLEVRDSGPGIPEAIRERIFDPFFTTKAEGEGTGLGLALVYGIVSAHGGRIEAPPCAEGGARFVITLPAGVPAQPATAPETMPSHPPAVRPARILVVDDERPVAEMIGDALALDGHRAVVAADGREALERIGREPFDLIISDLRMPGMGGEGLLAELRQARPELVARVLLTSGDTVSAETDRFVERNGVSLLRKPFGVERLRRAVRERLARLEDD